MAHPFIDPDTLRALRETQRILAGNRSAIMEARQALMESGSSLMEARRALVAGSSVMEAQRALQRNRLTIGGALALLPSLAASGLAPRHRSGPRHDRDLPEWVGEAPEPAFRAWLEGNL